MAKTFRYSGYVTSTGFDIPLLLVFNGDDFGSGRKINILNANARPVKPQVLTAFGKLTTQRITAATGGDSVYVTKFDTSSSDLPSQVDIKIDTDVTLGSSLFGAYIALPPAASPFMFKATGFNYNLSTYWNTSRQEGSTQHIKLAEGEGLAITQLNAKPHPSGTWQMHCIIKVGTSYYCINTALFAREYPTACFSIMNNTGSGVDVEVVSMEINEIGSATITTPASDAPYVGFKRIEGYLGGQEVTPIAFDSSDTLPSTIKVVRNRLYLDLQHYEAGSKSGSANKYGYGYPSAFMIQARSAGLFRNTLTHIADAMNVNLAATFPASGLKARVADFDLGGSNSSFTPIVLNPQEGFSIQAMNMTHYATYYLEIEFTHTPPVVAGGGLKSTVIVT